MLSSSSTEQPPSDRSACMADGAVASSTGAVVSLLSEGAVDSDAAAEAAVPVGAAVSRVASSGEDTGGLTVAAGTVGFGGASLPKGSVRKNSTTPPTSSTSATMAMTTPAVWVLLSFDMDETSVTTEWSRRPGLRRPDRARLPVLWRWRAAVRQILRGWCRRRRHRPWQAVPAGYSARGR